MTCHRDAGCQKPLTNRLEMFVLTHLPADLTNPGKYPLCLLRCLGLCVILDRSVCAGLVTPPLGASASSVEKRKLKTHLLLCCGVMRAQSLVRAWRTVGVQSLCALDLLEAAWSGFSLPTLWPQTLTCDPDKQALGNFNYSKHPAPV